MRKNARERLNVKCVNRHKENYFPLCFQDLAGIETRDSLYKFSLRGKLGFYSVKNSETSWVENSTWAKRWGSVQNSSRELITRRDYCTNCSGSPWDTDSSVHKALWFVSLNRLSQDDGCRTTQPENEYICCSTAVAAPRVAHTWYRMWGCVAHRGKKTVSQEPS